MMASQLIESLTEIIEKEGDLEVIDSFFGTSFDEVCYDTDCNDEPVIHLG